MKKIIFLFIIAVSVIFNSIAQPNASFENWHTEFSYENPDEWATLNFLSLLSPPNPLSTFKAIGIDKHSGNYALMLKTIIVNNNPTPEIIGDTVSGIFTGKINLSPYSYIYGFPYTGRPAKMEFWAKYAPVGNDTAETIVVMFKRNGSIRDTIAVGIISIPATPAYSLFQIDITYYSAAIPDTASIAFGSSKYASGAEPGSTLFIDDLTFTGWVGMVEQELYSNSIKLFPNPAKESLTIQSEIEEAENMLITDVSGKTLSKIKIQNCNANVNTGSFAEGIYLYEITDKTNKILIKGKFNVLK